MRAPLPPREHERLELLHQLAILDSPREERFDNLANLAQLLCDAPVAVITLIDQERQWFKSCLGLEGSETSRDIAFCAHTILASADPLVVPDTHLDPRFRDNPQVTGEPHIRFYAGVPLEVAPGLALGSLCVVDFVPRQLSPQQQQGLVYLAQQVVQLLALHRSHRQQAQQAGRFAKLSNSIPLLIGQLNKQLRYEFANSFYRDWFDLAPESMIGKTAHELFPCDYADQVQPLLLRVLQGETRYLERRVAQRRHIELSYSPIRTDGEVTGIFVIGVDISDRIQHAQALEQERRSLDLAIRGANLGTWQWNLASGALRVNDRWCEILGYTMAELEPISVEVWLRLMHPDDLILAIQARDEHCSGRASHYEQRFRMRHKNGHWVWIFTCGQVLTRAPDGTPAEMFGTHADITAAEEARHIIARNEQKLSTLYQLAPVSMVLNRLSDGVFLEGNPEFYRMLGYSPEEFSNHSYWDITPPEYIDAEREQLNLLHTTGRYGPYEKQYIHRNGHKIPVLLNGVLIDSSDGEKHIWSIIQDITERKRIEQLKNDFVSVVSHELRTPLTSISGALSLVLSGPLGELPLKAQQMISIAHKNAQRLGELINDLLDMEKLAAGKMDMELHCQPLLAILEQSLDANRGYAEQYGVHLQLNAPTEAIYLLVDAQRLQQVLANFLSNAIKFSPPQGLVTLSASVEQQQVRIAVSDRGPGISDNFRHRIFQKFSQADASSSRQRGGTGLGLAISKELVEHMGGQIGFDSTPGQGACFFMLFPQADKHDHSNAGDSAGSTHSHKSIHSNKPHETPL